MPHLSFPPPRSTMSIVRPGRGGRRAFTLLELVVVMVIMGVLAGVAVLGYGTIQRNQTDSAGYPILGAAQIDARQVAAGNADTFPGTALLVGQMNSEAVSTGGSSLNFLSDPDGSQPSPDASDISVDRGDAATVGLAVMTSTGSPTDGHCLLMLDSLTAGSTWVTMKNALAGGINNCQASFVYACRASLQQLPGAGTSGNPYQLSSGAGCQTPVNTSLNPPTCIVAQPQPLAGQTVQPVVLTWSPSPDAGTTSSYTIVATPTVRGPATVTITGLDPTSTSYTVTSGLVAGATYTFSIYAVDANGLQSATATASNTVQLVPGAPIVTVTGGSPSHLGLSWAQVTGADHYVLTRQVTSNNATLVTLATVPASSAVGGTLSYTDSTVAPGTAYTYTVTPVTAATAPTSQCSVTVTSGGSGATGPVLFTTQLAAPHLTVTPATGGFAVAWNTVTGADHYQLLRYGPATGYLTGTLSPAQLASFTTIATNLPATATTYLDTNPALVPGSNPAAAFYTYLVEAVDAAGDPPAVSNTDVGLLPPSASSLNVSAVSTSEIDAAWTVPATTLTETLLRRPLSTPTYSTDFTSSTAPLTATQKDTGLPPGTSYAYEIRVDDTQQLTLSDTQPDPSVAPVPRQTTVGGPTTSSPVTATTWSLTPPTPPGPPPVPQPPSSFAAYATTFTQNTLVWSPDSTVTTYTVQSSPNNSAWTTLGTLSSVAGGSSTVPCPPAGSTASTNSGNPGCVTTAPLGSTTYYRVEATNSSGTSGWSASNAAQQYPVNPTVLPFAAQSSSSSNSSNITDGTNIVRYVPGSGDSSYNVYDWLPGQGSATPLTTGTTATSATNTEPRGSMYDYTVVGVNNCHTDAVDPNQGRPCWSENGAGDGIGSEANDDSAAEVSMRTYVSIYQRPANQTLNVVTAPTPATDNATVGWVLNDDAGNGPGNGWCTSTAGAHQCSYKVQDATTGSQLYLYNGVSATQTTLDLVVGTSTYLQVVGCNAGGCSDPGPIVLVKTYPGVLSMWGNNVSRGFDFVTNAGLRRDQQFTASLTWNPSTGDGVQYRYMVTNAAGWDAYSTATTSDAVIGNPNQVYTWTVQATASNGLSRTFSQDVQMGTPTISQIDAIWQCDSAYVAKVQPALVNQSTRSPGSWRIEYTAVNELPAGPIGADELVKQEAEFWGYSGYAGGGQNNDGTDGVHNFNSYASGGDYPTTYNSSPSQGYWWGPQITTAANHDYSNTYNSWWMANVQGVGSYTTFALEDTTSQDPNAVLPPSPLSAQLALGNVRGASNPPGGGQFSGAYVGCTNTNGGIINVPTTYPNYSDTIVGPPAPRKLVAGNPAANPALNPSS
jgi:prepilin-type N-terminal cleavage/methylation domain-containing protein